MITDILKRVFNNVYKFTGLFSLIAICTMAGMILSDLVKSEYSYAVVPADYPPTFIKTTGGHYTNSLIIVGSGKAELHIEILDTKSNEVAYEYKTITVSAFGTLLDRSMTLYIPPLPEGIYKIRGILYYSANLIMQSKIYINMGTVVVEE